MLEKILALLGITHDIAENTRETKTDIEDNRPKKEITVLMIKLHLISSRICKILEKLCQNLKI